MNTEQNVSFRCNSPVEELSRERETLEQNYLDMNHDDDDGRKKPTSTPSSRGWFKWGNTSMTALKEAEQSILAVCRRSTKGILVNIGSVVDENDSKIWTIILNEEMKNEETPILMVHGLGAGVALWAKNLDALAQNNRTVYAIDVLGFGQSSRSTFSMDAMEAELQFVKSIEAWRIAMGLEKFILLGHSLGGYICTSYAIKYPSRVCHLILADPWGFQNQPADLKEISHIPVHHRLLVRIMEPLNLNPLWSIRLLGGLFAPKLIQKIRADLISQFNMLEDASTKISNYIYQCNVQNPTGETAFHCMMIKFGWAKNPMNLRLSQLDSKIPMTLIYGAHSWVDHFPIDQIRALRPNSVVDGHILAGAGHHVYADKSQEFNEIVTSVCDSVDDEDTILFYGEACSSTERDSNDNFVAEQV